MYLNLDVGYALSNWRTFSIVVVFPILVDPHKTIPVDPHREFPLYHMNRHDYMVELLYFDEEGLVFDEVIFGRSVVEDVSFHLISDVTFLFCRK